MTASNMAPHIGQCIYCGTDDGPLTDEHWFPMALGGKQVLAKASCKPCAHIINSRFESRLLSSELANHRRLYGLPSRKNKKAKGKREVFHDVFGRPFSPPLKDTFALTFLYRLSEAGVLCGRHQAFDGSAFVPTVADHGSMEKFVKKYPHWDKKIRMTFQPHDTARLVAKTVYGWMIANFGYKSFHSFIPEVLIGDVSPQQLVGCKERNERFSDETPIRLFAFGISPTKLLLIAEHDLYGSKIDFTFEIIAGILDITNPEHRMALASSEEAKFTQRLPEAVLSNLHRIGLAELL